MQIVLAAAAMNRDVGVAYNAGPRDVPAEFSPLTGRLRRAVDNHFEALIFFTIAVMVVTLSGAASGLTAACAWIYLAAASSTSPPTPSAGRRGARSSSASATRPPSS